MTADKSKTKAKRLPSVNRSKTVKKSEKPAINTISPPDSEEQPAAVRQSKNRSLLIVGIGASAGGLEAFEQFFHAMPSDSGMAYVLVSHLDPGHASMLTEILQRVTKMPVVEVEDQMKLKPNYVYPKSSDSGLSDNL